MSQNLTIIGLGLLGGSIAAAARQRASDCRIVGCGHREGSLIDAQKAGLIDRWTLDVADAVAAAELVVLCLPVRQIPTWLEKIAPHLPAGCVVTDVGSTKSAIVEAGENCIRPPALFVGSHPMAGSEKTGVSAARADLFDGATCVLTPTPATDAGALRRVDAFWQSLGCRTVQHTPADHDRLVALVSHLPHVTAAALVAVQEAASLALHGRGFLDTTRIAAGDAGLWTEILLENRENVIASIERLTAELATLMQLLESSDAASLNAWLAQSSKVAAALRGSRPASRSDANSEAL